MPDDPRKAKTLGEAAANDDGTWNGALSWLSEALHPGKSEAEVRKLWDEARAKRALQHPDG